MPEAEDLVVGAARHATSFAMDLWRRNRAHEAGDAQGLALRDVRGRLELLVEAATGPALRIRTAVSQRPHTLLERMWRRGARRHTREVVPGTDGVSIFLPARFETASVDYALDLYRILALEQAMRCRRSTAAAYPWAESPLVQDLFLISESAAADGDLAAACPGLARAVSRVKNAMSNARPPLHSLAEPLRSVEALYRSILAGTVSAMLPRTSAVASIGWARETAFLLPRAKTYRGMVSDAFLGEVLKPDAVCAPSAADADPSKHDGVARRAVQLARRPRARRAADDEDDEQPGMWMIQTTEPSEHVEDPMGLQRPVDQAPEADLQGVSESVSDLEELRLVATPGTSPEVLIGDDDLPARAARGASTIALPRDRLAYPEWDYTVCAYREGAARVCVEWPREGSAQWVDRTLARHHATLKRVRRRFEALRARRTVQHGQPEGDEVDLDAFVSAYGERRARLPRTDRLYLAQRPARRDFALLMLIDTSGSTDAWVGADQRIIDVEKEALVVVSAALEALRVPFAIHAFSGYGPGDVRVRHVKAFSERFESGIARRIAALEPEEYTRSGAALRHATATLMREPAHRRLLLVLSDAKPNDCDRYEGRYGIEDTRQAIAEARLQGIAPFCVSVDRDASRHLPLVFGTGNYAIVREPPQLMLALLDWLRAVTLSLQ